MSEVQSMLERSNQLHHENAIEKADILSFPLRWSIIQQEHGSKFETNLK